MLWRSAHHEAATDEDLAALDALGLETVVDLGGDDDLGVAAGDDENEDDN